MNEINFSIQVPEVIIMDATEKFQESRSRHLCKLSNDGGSALPRWRIDTKFSLSFCE
jgi:hypothetical protein